MDFNVIIEGYLKFRDGRKWKNRWCVVRKLSPVADCLHLQLYRESKDQYKQGTTKASLSLEHFIGTEIAFFLDKESNTMAIICRDLIVTLAFDSRERLIQWSMKMNSNLGESTQYSIHVCSSPAKARLIPGPARLHVQNGCFCVTSSVPPKLIGYWEIKHLRRFGVVDGKFCFEGGAFCDYGQGLYIFLTDESEDIASSVHSASRGRLAPKKPYVTRNISGTEKSSRQYIHYSSESSGVKLQNSPSKGRKDNCRSFTVYKWASMVSNVDTNSAGKESEDYLYHAQSQNFAKHWSDFSDEELANRSTSNREAAYESYNLSETISDVDLYADMEEMKHDVTSQMTQDDEKTFKSSSKLSNIKSLEDPQSTTLMGSSQQKCKCTSEALPIAQNHLHDGPKIFHSCNQRKVIYMETNNLHSVKEFSMECNVTKMPTAVIADSICSCNSTTTVIVPSKKCYTFQNDNKETNCPCQHLGLMCWPYNWLQLAYCRRGDTFLDTSTTFQIVDRQKPESKMDPASLYARVDLSKKTKKLSNGLIEVPPKISIPPPRPTQPKPNVNQNDSNNSYTNLYFENTLKYYENARDLIKNTFASRNKLESNETRCCDNCSSESPAKMNSPENYLNMNPVCPTSARSKSKVNHASEERFTLHRRRSDSLGSAKSAPSSMRREEVNRMEDFSLLSRDKTSQSDKTMISFLVSTDGNQDSSSSNDSGFSFGSLNGKECEIQFQPLINVNATRLPQEGRVQVMRSLDPCNRAGKATAPCHQQTASKTEIPNRSVGKIHSISFNDSRSTSSETSDISDYIETLSLSSHSSSENSTTRVNIHHLPSSVLRPRSGKEYEKVNRILIQHRSVHNQNVVQK